jgi:hypothetical protein
VDDNPMPTENSKPMIANGDITAKDNEVIDELATPPELESDLGPYWTLAQSCQAYVINTITSYSNIEASKSTPQYGFNRGLKEFGELGYRAAVKELDDNLLGMGAVTNAQTIRTKQEYPLRGSQLSHVREEEMLWEEKGTRLC